MEEVKLFGAYPSPFSYRVIWGLKLKGIDYKYIEEDLSNKSASLLKYSPIHKKIPVLVHGGKPITESTVILEYIDETFPEHPLLPKDPYERSVARFWVKFLDDKIQRIGVFFGTVGEKQEKAIEDLLEMLRVIEEHSGIGQKKFFAGDEIGMVDLAYGILAHWLGAMEEVIGVELINPHKFPNLHAWKNNFKESPFIKENTPTDEEMVALLSRRRETLLASAS